MRYLTRTREMADSGKATTFSRMRQVARGGLLILAVCLGHVDPAWTAELQQPIVTNKNRFHIQFRFDAAVLQRMQARELQLFASSDQGRRWQFVQ